MLAPDTLLQNRYRIVRQLGQGGMGTVYEAIDERLNAPVALKETFFTDERMRKQFEREAQLLARLHHPALPRVSDHFTEGDGQFLVMQFIPGEDLWEMLQKQGAPFPPDKVLIWADQLLDALDYLHSQEPPVIHRDIKPQNLKLTGRNQIILLDFGLAKGFAGQISRVSTSGSIFGYTPNYAPLEQIQGTGTDIRSDLYSLAATLYHLMTGTVPPNALDRASANITEQPDPLRPANEISPHVSADVAGVLHQAMAQNPSKRFPSAAKMREALDTGRQRGREPKVQAATLLETQAYTPPPTPGVEDQTAKPLEQIRFAPAQPPHERSSASVPDTLLAPAGSSPAPPYGPSVPNTFSQFPPPYRQPARKSRAGFWLLMGTLTAALVVVVVVLAINYSRRNSVSSNSDEATGEPVDRRGTKGEVSGSGEPETTALARWSPKGDEGTVTGRINLTGLPPAPQRIDMGADANCMSKNPNLLTETVVARDGKLQNVFVYLKDGTLADGKKLSDYSFDTPPTDVKLDLNGCHFIPHVLGAQAGQKIRFTNSDPTTHNVHALPASGRGNEEWNELQGPSAPAIIKTFKRPEVLIPIKCNVHNWMKAYVGVVRHPFFAVSRADGSFEIRGVPPGTYTIVAWHERYGEKTAQVKVVAGGTATADFTYDSATSASNQGGSLKVMPAMELPMLASNHQ